MNAEQGVREGIDDGVQLLEGQRTLLELTVGHRIVDQLLDHRPEVVGGGLLDGPTGRLDPVGEEDDSSLAGVGTDPGVAEVRLVDDLIGARLLQGLDVEVLDDAGAVVHQDGVEDRLGELVLLSDGGTIDDVVDDDPSGLVGLEAVVGVGSAALVLDEELRLERLADVVEVAGNAGAQGMGTDGLRSSLRQRGDGHGVVIGARRAQHELAEERVVEVGKLQQLEVRHEAEQLEDRDQSEHQKCRQDAARKREGDVPDRLCAVGERRGIRQVDLDELDQQHCPSADRTRDHASAQHVDPLPGVGDAGGSGDPGDGEEQGEEDLLIHHQPEHRAGRQHPHQGRLRIHQDPNQHRAAGKRHGVPHR